jgi:glutamine synthetase
LTLALMLGTGLLGMREQLSPSAERVSGGGAITPPLPRDLEQALSALEACPLAGEVLGQGFVNLYAMVKRHELTEQAADADFAIKHLLSRS